MKKHVSTILLVLVFFIGCSLMLYPIVSDWWNSKVQTRAVTEYSDAVDTMDAQTCEEILTQAESYNTSLAALDYPLSGYGVLSAEYTQALNLPNTDVMGYITIDKLNVKLPIYHGTSDSALAVGVGHLEGSSLPVGGASTHAVLSAHRGLPTSRLFTDLDKMEEGDIFSITVLNRTLTYQVDQILIVEPQDVAALQIVPGEDLCTLLTCTPYGINTHRLLVRGHRVDTPVAKNITIPNEATRLDSLLLAPVIAVPMLLVLLVYLLVRYRRRKPESAPMPERASKDEWMRARGSAETGSDDVARQSAAAEPGGAGLSRVATTSGDAAQRRTPAKSGEMDQGRPAKTTGDAAQHPEPSSAASVSQLAAEAKHEGASQFSSAVSSDDAPSPSASTSRKGDSQSPAPAGCGHAPRTFAAADGGDARRPSVAESTDDASQPSTDAGSGAAAQPPEVAGSGDASQFAFVANAKEVSPLLAVASTADTSLDSVVTHEAILAFLADDAADDADTANAADGADDAASDNDSADIAGDSAGADAAGAARDASLSLEEDDCEDVYLGAHFAKPSADRTRRNDRRGR